MISDTIDWWPDRSEWPEYGPVDCGGRPVRIMTSAALALLMLEDIVVTLWAEEAGGGVHTVGLYVLCSDTFAYACADSEPIPPVGFGQDEPFWRLYDLVRKHGCQGATAWCVERRQTRPIEPVVRHLKEAGLWTNEMELYKPEKFNCHVKRVGE